MSVLDESLAPKLAKHTGQTVKELILITLLNTIYIYLCYSYPRFSVCSVHSDG